MLLVLVFHSAQGFITMRDIGYTGADLARQEWIELAIWTVVAGALIGLDRGAWRPSGRGTR